VTEGRLQALRALTARLVPGPPEDQDPGALEAGAAEAIASMLDAFAQAQPAIHVAQDGRVVPLDSVSELGWRIRIEGSRGLAEREFAGPVAGLTEAIEAGLALLDRHAQGAHGVDFAASTAAEQDALLGAGDEELAAFVRLAMTLTLEATYGSPLHGGNRGEVGWQAVGWPGFTEPRGFTAAEVSEPDQDACGAETGSASEAVSELRSRLPDGAGWQSDAG
jgi:gluconate 2-dehydrogenase gamma chain